jgi:hypothetical protein
MLVVSLLLLLLLQQVQALPVLQISNCCTARPDILYEWASQQRLLLTLVLLGVWALHHHPYAV